MERPDTRYARSGDFHIAYQVVGEGSVDLVYVPGWVSQLDQYWEEPSVARFFRRLASFSRLIVFDKRGIGLSDPVASSAMPTLEERMDDIRAVLDAVGSKRAAVLGQGYGCPIAALFAASHPERTAALVLYSPVAKAGVRTDDYPWGATAEGHRAWLEETERRWGSAEFAQEWVGRLAPSSAEDARFVQWAGRMMRAAASPSTARAFTEMNGLMDAREVLPLIRVPTLAIEREHVRPPKGPADIPPLEEARWVAAQIPAATLLELPGCDYLPWVGDQESLVSAIASFVTGAAPVPEPERVLMSVLFTDVVGSTARAAQLGDRRWRELLERHDAVVRRQLERYRGVEVKRTGDGVLATFDGPARAIRCAHAVADELKADELSLRASVHAGEVEILDGDIGGIAVHIGARVLVKAEPGEVLVTGTVRDLVAGSGIEFSDRGAHALKGVPGRWRLYAARSA
jgi:class 3 adenylate cyclase/pimeloyl-ACP methyl ester carboxylesterase